MDISHFIQFCYILRIVPLTIEHCVDCNSAYIIELYMTIYIPQITFKGYVSYTCFQVNKVP